MTAQPKAAPMAAAEPRRVPMKIELALSLVIEADRAGRYLTALDALAAFGDSCWHSTVADLRAKGLEFIQRSYEHRHQHGGAARFQEYRLAPGHREKAERILGTYRQEGRGHE